MKFDCNIVHVAQKKVCNQLALMYKPLIVLLHTHFDTHHKNHPEVPETYCQIQNQ